MNRNFFRTCSMVGALALLAACGETTVGPKGALAPNGPSFTATEPFNGPGVCMANDAVLAPTGTISGVKQGDDPATALNCTSNDVSIAQANLLFFATIDPNTGNFGAPVQYTGQNVECVEGDPIKLTLSAQLKETAESERTDVGIWIATDGGDAQTGLCNHYNLVNGSQGVSTETGNLIPDSCGDLASGAVVDAFPLGDITTICHADSPTDTDLHVGSCLAWKEPGADALCPLTSQGATETGFRWGTLYGNKSKCNCDGFDVPITVVQKAYLEVVKACVPTTDLGKFDLQIDGTTKKTDAACGETTGKLTVGAGTTQSPGESHTFGELAGTGTSLSSYTSTRTCVNRTGGTRLAAGAGTGGSVTLQPNDDVVCTITNTAKATLIIEKVSVGGVGQFDFTSTGGLPSPAVSGAFSLTTATENVAVNATFSNLTPGAFSVTETTPSDYVLTNVSCTTGGTGDLANSKATVTLAAGATVTCTFTNTKKGSIKIIKDDQNPATSPVDFPFTATGTGMSDFTLDDDADGTFPNFKLFTGLAAGGTRVVTESANSSWDLTGISCTGGGTVVDLPNRKVTITLAAGAAVECTFVNQRKAKLTVSKVVTGGGAQVFDFSRTGISNFTLSNGQSNASGFSLAPGTYTVCELTLAVSWSATATLDGQSVTLVNPDASKQPPEDVGNRCYDVVLAYGDDKTIVFTNSPPPGGDARTIGYWKNWSSCTGGRQYQKATERGILNKTLDGNLPITIGNLTITTCQAGVYILDKRDLAGNKKASDAAYNMAAQLLAAMLNRKALSGNTCNIDQLIIDANALLVQLNFTGTGSYLGKGADATLIAKANNYATLLDKYNNNVCVNYVP